MVLRACLGAGALALLLATSGCSDDPQPRVEPTVDSPAPSPSETTSAEPAAWEVKSKAGAVAFAKHWVDVLNEAAATGELDALRSISSEKCESCGSFADLIESVYAAGRSFEGGTWQVVASVPTPDLDETVARVAMRIRQEPQRLVRGNSTLRRYPGGMVTYSAHLDWAGSSWEMTDLELVQ